MNSSNVHMITFMPLAVVICFPFCIKVHLTPKYFFGLNKSLHLFETHCTSLSLFNSYLDFLQAAKVTKSGHHLFHDRASKGHGTIPGLTSQTSLYAYLQRHTTKQISLGLMMARFCNFYELTKSHNLV